MAYGGNECPWRQSILADSTQFGSELQGSFSHLRRLRSHGSGRSPAMQKIHKNEQLQPFCDGEVLLLPGEVTQTAWQQRPRPPMENNKLTLRSEWQFLFFIFSLRVRVN